MAEIVKGNTAKVVVTPENLGVMLGVQRFNYGLAEESDQVGVTTGLAWTEVGGDLLQIEALRLPGKGRMKTTGKLGDVMKESIEAAASYVRSKSPELGIKPPVVISLAKRDEEIYIPGLDEPLRLSRHAYALRLLQYVRDEAHRFAQHYHHTLRRKGALD